MRSFLFATILNQKDYAYDSHYGLFQSLYLAKDRHPIIWRTKLGRKSM